MPGPFTGVLVPFSWCLQRSYYTCLGWLVSAVLVAVLASTSHSSPIITIMDIDIDPAAFLKVDIGADFCVLPPELGSSGNVTFLEDCRSLDRLVLSRLMR